MVCITPILPSAARIMRTLPHFSGIGHSLNRPPKALPTKAAQKFVEKPTMSRDIRVPAHPIRRTGFRPILSETPPHARPVRDSAREKEEMKMPAQKDALDLSPTPKSRTMSHAYGKHEARAIGSATRHIAGDE